MLSMIFASSRVLFVIPYLYHFKLFTKLYCSLLDMIKKSPTICSRSNPNFPVFSCTWNWNLLPEPMFMLLNCSSTTQFLNHEPIQVISFFLTSAFWAWIAWHWSKRQVTKRERILLHLTSEHAFSYLKFSCSHGGGSL